VVAMAAMSTYRLCGWVHGCPERVESFGGLGVVSEVWVWRSGANSCSTARSRSAGADGERGIDHHRGPAGLGGDRGRLHVHIGSREVARLDPRPTASMGCFPPW